MEKANSGTEIVSLINSFTYKNTYSQQLTPSNMRKM